MAATKPLSAVERKERRRARKGVFQTLYALDSTGTWSPEAARVHLADLKPPLMGSALRFAEQIITAYFEKRAEIEDKLEHVHEHWKTNRMGLPERNILRMALAEIGSGAKTPVSVVIAEANSMADTFGGPEQSAFVGGMLNELAGRHLTLVREG